MNACKRTIRRMRTTLAATLAALTFGATAVSAVPLSVAVDGYFQIDTPSADVCGGGSITTGTNPPPTACVDTPGPIVQGGGADDWDTLLTCSGTEGNCNPTNLGNNSEPVAFIFGPATSSIFTGGSSKDQTDI